MTVRHSRIEPYGVPVHLATDQAGWDRLRRRYKGALRETPRALGSTDSLDHERGYQWQIVVWIDTAAHPDAHSAMLTAVHEAVHAAAMTLDHVGQPYDGGSEALAYLVEWITGWLWDGIAPTYTEETS